MAFYGCYSSDAGDDYPVPSYCTSDYNIPLIPSQDSFLYSSWSEFDCQPESDFRVFAEPEPISSSGGYYDYYLNQSETSYSVHHYSNPKLLRYDRSIHETGYVSSDDKDKAEFNAPEFKKYAPDPYSGGYDPITTYGRPLSPSDEICYPRSTPQSDGSSLTNFSYGSIESAYGKDDVDVKPIRKSKETDEKPNFLANGGKGGRVGVDVETSEPISSDESPIEVDDDSFESGEYGYKSEQQLQEIPYGSGLEAIDLCDSIFGYWPCLAKIEKERKQQQQRDKPKEICDQGSRKDPWEIAADYLFGSPLVYNYQSYHYQHQSQY